MCKRTECRGTEEVHLTRVVTRQHAGGFEFHSRYHIDGGDHLKPPFSPLPATVAKHDHLLVAFHRAGKTSVKTICIALSDAKE